MIKAILSLYDYFRNRPAVAWLWFVAVTGVLALSFLTLHYKEDISDFLPLDDANHTALAVYQDISGANNIIVTVSLRDTSATEPQMLADGVEIFVGNIEETDSLAYISNITKEIDTERILDVVENVYNNIPYYLTDRDYDRIDSLLATPNFVSRQLEEDKQMLLFPSSSLLTGNISRDPLGLFTPVLSRISQCAAGIEYDTFDGYILSPDQKKAIVIIESSFGANESENNARLIRLLEEARLKTEENHPALDIHIIGGPAIAVTNANQIKKDSVLAVAIAGILILALLIYVFRNARNILLIFVSVGWGWLFAMGGIALFYNSISIIVLGIASVILGIAVNYPLHLIDHLQHRPHPRQALKEIVSPLVVGNITTVGAFLCLVPLNSIALHDLGLFSSLLLIGTVLFVLIFLPHVIKVSRCSDAGTASTLISKIADISVEKNRWVLWGVLGLTIFFAYFSFKTEFDADMRNINFMTPGQRVDLEYFANLRAVNDSCENIYVVASGTDWDCAMEQNRLIDRLIDRLVEEGSANRKKEVTPFVPSREEQGVRLDKWRRFTATHRDRLLSETGAAAMALGFSEDAFLQFYSILQSEYTLQSFEYFEDISNTVLAGNLSSDSAGGRFSVVQILEVNPRDVDAVIARLESTEGFNGLVFDVKSMNSSITNTLSDDFNYIGIACGFIVFIFLWLSLGSIELAIVSFLPMAVSWIWILGIMGMLGIKFNIVNIILATFIFG